MIYIYINLCHHIFPPCLQDYQEVIASLPEFDKPSYFGLPENIERSAQRIISAQVISQLRILQRANVKASRFDKEVWATELGPVLNLWKKLNQVGVKGCLKWAVTTHLSLANCFTNWSQRVLTLKNGVLITFRTCRLAFWQSSHITSSFMHMTCQASHMTCCLQFEPRFFCSFCWGIYDI